MRIHPETLEAISCSTEEGRPLRVSVTIGGQPGRRRSKGWLPIHPPAVNALTLPVVDPESDDETELGAAYGRRPQPSKPSNVGRGQPTVDGEPHRRLMACRRRLAGLEERRPGPHGYTPWLFMRKNYAG